MTEKFSLKWKDFQTNVVKKFSNLRFKEDYYDVTLVSADQEKFQAHRLVLSACSPYFDNILKSDKGTFNQLMLCLDNVTSTDVNNILDYIYNGEVQILENELNQFLAIADRFQLEGLTGMKEDENDLQPEINSQPESSDTDFKSQDQEIPSFHLEKTQMGQNCEEGLLDFQLR